MEMIATIFVIIAMVLVVIGIVVYDRLSAGIKDAYERTEDLAGTMEAHSAILRKHELLHTEQDAINRSTIRANSNGG